MTTEEIGKQIKFCPNCHILVQGNECPVCYSDQLYSPEPYDFCLLNELEVIWAGVLEECLTDHDIPYTEENAVGAWLSARLGVAFERKRIYVPYDKLEQAKALMEELFQGEYIDETD